MVLMLATLTEQDDDAQQDGHESAGAETGGARLGLGVAHFHVALTVARAHPHCERARAALHGVVAVGDDHGQAERALL